MWRKGSEEGVICDVLCRWCSALASVLHASQPSSRQATASPIGQQLCCGALWRLRIP